MISKIITYLATFSLAILLPVQNALLAVSFLLIADAITGIIASMKEGEKFSSRKLKHTVVKTFLYQLTILMSSMAEQHLFHNSFPMANVTLSVIGMVEITSLVENLSRYTGNDVGKLIKNKLTNLLGVDKKDKEDETK